MRKIGKAAASVGLAGALTVGALVAVPALADGDDATVDSPVRYEQLVDDTGEVTLDRDCTGNQQRDRDRDQFRVHQQDRDCDGAQIRHQHGLGNGFGREPGSGTRPGPGPRMGECPYAPSAD